MLQCGHTFCGGCFESTLDPRGEGSCATCRAEADADSASPNFTVRDIVGGLTVKCPECGGAAEGRKRRRDEDEPSGEDGCGEESRQPEPCRLPARRRGAKEGEAGGEAAGVASDDPLRRNGLGRSSGRTRTCGILSILQAFCGARDNF